MREALIAFATVLGSLGLLAAAVTAGKSHGAPDRVACWNGAGPKRGRQPVLLHCAAGWFLLFHLALKKLPPVQEALGLK